MCGVYRGHEPLQVVLAHVRRLLTDGLFRPLQRVAKATATVLELLEQFHEHTILFLTENPNTEIPVIESLCRWRAQ